jgi:DNA polymerase-3 subunit alpha
MAALLTSVIGNSDKVGLYIEECKRMGIPVYPPDVNKSQLKFAEEGEGIRFGLLAVKNLGEGAIAAILQEREKAPFTSLADFCRRLDPGVINKRAVESLIKAGAFASTAQTRRAMLESLPVVFENSQRLAAARREGQLSFFDLEGEFAVPETERRQVEEYPPATLLAMEKEFLGVYLTGNPLDPWKEKFRQNGIPTLLEILEDERDREVLAGGVVSAWKRVVTKAGKLMASFRLEDMTASLEVLVFPKLYEEVHEMAGNDRVVVVKGRLDTAEEEKKLLASQIRWLT